MRFRQMKLAEEMGTSGLLFINDKTLLTWDSDVYRTWDIGTGKPARGQGNRTFPHGKKLLVLAQQHAEKVGVVPTRLLAAAGHAVLSVLVVFQ